MKKNPVIHPDCLPTRSPILLLAVAALLLERCDIPGWGWGVFGSFSAVMLLGWLLTLIKEDHKKLPPFGGRE